MEHEPGLIINDDPEDNGQWTSLAGIEFGGNNHPNTTEEPTVNTDPAETQTPNPAESSMAPIGLEVLSTQNQKAILDSIPSPTDGPDGIRTVTNEILKNESESRILAWVSDENPYRLNQLTPENLEDFVTNYPTPADFQALSDSFMTMIEAYSNKETIEKYKSAMANFKNKVYGLKQVYYDQMRTVDALLDQHQIEHSLEWEPGVAKVAQVTRSQVIANELDPQHPSETCQDAYLLRPDLGIFGVFDGASGHVGGREASHAAAEFTDQACDKYNPVSSSDLAHVLNEANSSVIAATDGKGYTTATLAKITEQTNGQKILSYAQVGDSRLYIVHADGTAEQITDDEGEGNLIYNALGYDEEFPAGQYSEISVVSGDRIVLCTDGITGDRGDDLMSPAELGQIVISSRTPEEAATNLVTAARKTDDRTALVFGV